MNDSNLNNIINKTKTEYESIEKDLKKYIENVNFENPRNYSVAYFSFIFYNIVFI